MSKTGVTIQGGDRMSRALRSIGDKLRRGKLLRVGFLEGATYPDGTSVPMVAAIQNFGAPAASIPARPFFSTMVRERSPGWGVELGKVMKATGYDGQRSLALMGERIGAQLQKSIIDTTEPELSPITLMLRKMRSDNPDLVVTGKVVGEAAARVDAGEVASGVSTKPLIYDAVMLNSVGYDVNGTGRKTVDDSHSPPA